VGVVGAPLIALAAASGFAVSTSLQHSAASRVTHSATTLSLLRQLATSRRWVLASLLGLTAFALHALALHLGSLALVQPLMLCGVVLAVPLRTTIGRRLPRRDEFLAVAVTIVGLIVLLSATTLSRGTTAPDPDRAALACLAALGLFAVLTFVASRQTGRHGRAAVLGASAGLLFGVMAGLIKLVANDIDTGGVFATLATWRPWLLVVFGLAAVSTNQRAFHAGPLADSMPILNVVSVLVAMVFGWLVFGEAPVQGPVALAVQIMAFVVMAVGLTWIARLEPAPASDPAPTLERARTR
jgi:drug/metabolite transporter (DMT)-like permease